MRRDGGRRIGEDETTVVAKDRMIMLMGRTESGARLGSMLGGTGGNDPGISASVDVRRSEECMRRRWDMLTARAMRVWPQRDGL